MKKSLYIFIFFISCLGSPGSLAAQTLNFRNYTVNNGLANSTVYYIHQDSKGFIWFATETGVNRYDGQNFQTFTMDDGLSDNEVLQIREDSKGRIWFLTLNGKLSYYLNNKFHNTENTAVLQKAFCKASFVSFFEDSKHRLWFSTNQREVVMIDGEDVEIFSSDRQYLTTSFIAENKRSEILILNRSNIYKYNNQNFTRLHSEHYPLSAKACFYDPKTKTLSFISKAGFVENNGENWVLKRKVPEEIMRNGISNFFFDNDKNTWINTVGNGVYIVSDSSNTASQHLLPGKYITHGLLDIDGNIWISTIGNGVYMLPELARKMQHYTVSNGLSDNSIYSLVKTPDERLVLGLKNGNLNIIKGNEILLKPLKNAESSYNPIKKLFYDQQNQSIWFASNNTLGEIKSDNKTIRYLRERDNLMYALKSFSISKSGKLAIALAAGVDILENKNAELIFESPNLSNPSLHFPSRAYTVFYDSAERLWFSNINGLQYQYRNKLTKLYQNDNQLKQRITDITELPDKTIACASYGFGVFILKDSKLVRTVTTKDGLGSNICKKVFYADGYLWVITGKGISKVSKDLKAIDNYHKENGLLSNEINDALTDKGSIYVASNGGLSIFGVHMKARKKKAIPLNLNYILINNEIIDLAEKTELNYRSNNLTVNFIGIDFNNPDQIIYEYRLKDDLPWTLTTNNTIEFGSLESGEYHLQIRAKGINSGWSKPILFDFVIKPPIWKTPWFIFLAIIILGPALFFLINTFYKRKRIKERERLLAKTKIIALEQQALQAMMNPHFIFNVMNSIQHFINTKDTVMANQLLTGFARLIRKNLEICNKSYISLEEELSYLSLYLALEKLRFGNKLKYVIDTDPEIDREETFIPSMLLQPFVENAIWHGIMPKETEGNIWIVIKQPEPNLLHICIEDDGIGIDNSYKLKTNDHISRGMELTQERINLLNKFDAPIQLDVQQVEKSGTRVTILIAI
ncbi:two-component regulator propeller domain-containing protein [Paradesertivirga mongoliensis]|uniref:Two-component regulator propeller domain-containing protein n=1 Tax=Paradesertivirga mongoliensis TaxID=2100740 RepID=A0ABW4ZNQ5_9SPHI|nr:sensor histidine kinase [Pedobacter mongoliensis]